MNTDFTNYGLLSSFLASLGLFIWYIKGRDKSDGLREDNILQMAKELGEIVSSVKNELKAGREESEQHENRANERAKKHQEAMQELVGMIQGNHVEQLAATKMVEAVVKAEKKELQDALISTYKQSYKNKMKAEGGVKS